MLTAIYRIVLTLLIYTLPFFVVARAADTPESPPFQEGRDYTQLDTPVPTSVADKIEVVELFWYGCPHCYDLEPAMHAWLKNKPDNVVFVQIPAAFGPKWEQGARAYYAADTLGVLDKVHRPIFDAINREKRNLKDEDSFAKFVAEHGVNEDAFRKAYKSFQTETRLRRGNQLARRYGVRGVPAIIVNGKYYVRSPRIFDVIDYLITKEAAAPQD